MAKIDCKNCIGWNRCGDPASNDNGDCSSYQNKERNNMAEEYGDTTIRIKEELKPLLKIGKYLSIAKDLDSLESTFMSWVELLREKGTELKHLEESYKVRTEALERMTKKYNSYTEIKNMTFSEKLKFLLNN